MLEEENENWKCDIGKQVFLAPMAGVTDLPFRLLCKEMGCGLVYSEMDQRKRHFI